MRRIIHARVVAEDTIIPDGCVEVEAGLITKVAPFSGAARKDDVDLRGDWLLPGFLDAHVHPRTAETAAEIRTQMQELSRDLLAVGTTGILWTVASIPLDRLPERLSILRDILADPPDPCVIMGIHMEGPYLHPLTKGATSIACVTDPQRLPPAKLLDAGGDALKYLSLSPDVPGAADAVRECVQRGVRVGIGHSLATPDQIMKAVEAGAGSVIHTFDNVPSVPMKEGGVRGVTIDEVSMTLPDLMNEVICDGVHVDPINVRLLSRAKGHRRVMLITDSVDGGRLLDEGTEITFGREKIYVHDGVGRLANGGLAGSTLTMVRAFRNYMAFTGASIPEAVRAASTNIAEFLGVNRGRIAPQCRADFTVLDAEMNPRTLRIT